MQLSCAVLNKLQAVNAQQWDRQRREEAERENREHERQAR